LRSLRKKGKSNDGTLKIGKKRTNMKVFFDAFVLTVESFCCKKNCGSSSMLVAGTRALLHLLHHSRSMKQCFY